MTLRRAATLSLLALALAVLPALAQPPVDTPPPPEEDAPWSPETFQTEFAASYTPQRALALCMDAAEETDDFDFLRLILDKWKSVDPDDAAAYFARRQASREGSPQAAVLRGLASQDPLDALHWARAAIALDPGNLAAYRLLTGVYMRNLFGETDPPEALVAAFERDKDAFQRLAEFSGDDPEALRPLEEYQLHAGDAQAALATFEKAKAAGARWAQDLELARIKAHLGDYGAVRDIVAKNIDSFVAAGRLSADERDDYVRYYYANSLRDAHAYEQLLTERRAETPAADDREARADRDYDVACLEAMLGRREPAVDALQAALDSGFTNAQQMKDDEDLKSLHDHPRWNALVAEAEAAHAAGAGARRTAILAEQVDRVAPDWTLRATDGTMVSLADLRGQVVLLDFWATWCGPCRMAMPVLDTWMKERKPAGVRVFSVNVWEQTPAGAAAFMKREGYGMELLFDGDDVAKAYGVTGIPYLCAIDAEGHLRFEEKGYSPELADKLDAWAGVLVTR
ncbi:redoxin domain-containing protein [bacterium]|nr:redoxin domain-containing protein [bacterium]